MMTISNLSPLLHNLQHKAVHSAPIEQHLDLSDGLRVSLRFEDGQSWLYLSRPGVCPSLVEAHTIFKHYPGSKPTQVTFREPQQQPLADGRFYLLTSWSLNDCAEAEAEAIPLTLVF